MKTLTKLSGLELHNQGAKLREEDKHFEALQYLTMAIAVLSKESNYEELVDALKDRCLTWKHLFLTSKDKVFRILAKKDAESMLEISQEKKLQNKLSTSYFRLGEISMLFEDYERAVKYYQLSLKYYIGPLSEKGDFRYHLGEAIYRNGEKEKGKKEMFGGLEEIKKGSSQIDQFLVHVWESGCYIRLAELLSQDNFSEAKNYYLKAKEITDSDPKLLIRRRQIKELGRRLGFD